MNNNIDMSVMNYKSKTGNINVDAGELRHLLFLIESYQKFVSDEHPENFLYDNFYENYNSYMEYFKNKYIVLGDLRVNEKSAFDFMTTIEKSLKLLTGEDYLKANELFVIQQKEYANYKKQREELQKSLEIIKNEKYSWII